MTESRIETSQFSFSKRPRRLRVSEGVRRLVRENNFSLDQLVMPYFVKEGSGVREPIESMPGQFRYSIDELLRELEDLCAKNISSILLFGLPDEKEDSGRAAWDENGIVQQALREIKKSFPELVVITDVCLCAYTRHGHCGLVTPTGEIRNDESIELLAKAAASHAEAGADIVAPSDMMDGRVRAIREKLDRQGFEHTPIMSYAVKYASAFYGPFRDAADSAPSFGDRKTYQMDPANGKEALREMALDVEEGADILMVKPAMTYLDVIKEASQAFHLPMAAYAVSGEYSMIKAASERGWMDEKRAVHETMTSLKRAGADILITYFAKDIPSWFPSLRSM